MSARIIQMALRTLDALIERSLTEGCGDNVGARFGGGCLLNAKTSLEINSGAV